MRFVFKLDEIQEFLHIIQFENHHPKHFLTQQAHGIQSNDFSSFVQLWGGLLELGKILNNIYLCLLFNDTVSIKTIVSIIGWLMNMEQLARETEVLRENLPQHYFVHHKFQTTWPGIKPRQPYWENANQPPELCHSSETG
jgi:hypothetical protein